MLFLTLKKGSTRRSVSIKSHSSVTQIKQEYQELKSKVKYRCILWKRLTHSYQNMEHLDMIAKQKSELEQLKNQLTTTNKAQEIEAQHKQTLSELAAKETQLEEIKKEMQALKETLELIQQEDQTAHLLAEKDKLIKEKECELETLQIQFENERAELVKPALAQVTSQLDELKETVSHCLDITCS